MIIYQSLNKHLSQFYDEYKSSIGNKKLNQKIKL